MPNNSHQRELRGIIKHGALSVSYRVLFFLHLPPSVCRPLHTRVTGDLLIKGEDESKSMSGLHTQYVYVNSAERQREKQSKQRGADLSA